MTPRKKSSGSTWVCNTLQSTVFSKVPSSQKAARQVKNVAKLDVNFKKAKTDATFKKAKVAVFGN